jgi:hypothetical protein
MADSWSEMCWMCKTQFVLICVIMVGLLTLIILLDYYKLQKKKKLIWAFVGILLALGCAVLVFVTIEAIQSVLAMPEGNTRIAVHTVTGLIGMIFLGAFITIIILELIKKNLSRRIAYSILFTTLGLITITLIVGVILIAFVLPDPIEDGSLHIASMVGFPALFLLSAGTIFVIYDEPKFVLYHGLTAGSSWLLTTLNVLLLFTMTEVQMNTYSGWIHAFHIICGATGLIAGFFSALFGISGQRKYAKLTGYITLGCWWTAYMVATFIVGL